MAKKQNFEESLARLEAIVDEMERTDLNLERSLTLFEEGIGLVRLCTGKLDETKKKIEVLVKKGTHLTKEPFVPKNNDEAEC